VDHPHGTTGDVASDQYHRYAEDIDLMSQINVDAYRFSIAWSRIMKLGEWVPFFPNLLLFTWVFHGELERYNTTAEAGYTTPLGLVNIV